ncbi:MAG TPA: hypothetical protein VIK21_03315 [Desulfuromonadaceae bacterium]|jgi:hypothetical protein
MADTPQETGWQGGLLAILKAVTEGTLVLFLKNLLDAWDLWSQLRDRATYHGMYEILDYRSTLDLWDPTGEKATISRRQAIRFLQDNVVAIHDHAWGDGKLFDKYHCQPGVPVDYYQDGSKHNVLISLRETKNRGDVTEFLVERTIAGGLLEKTEWLETEVDHLTARLCLSIIFPKARPCLRATLTSKNANKTVVLDGRAFKTLESGRQELNLTISRPKLHETYTVKWDW